MSKIDAKSEIMHLKNIEIFKLILTYILTKIIKYFKGHRKMSISFKKVGSILTLSLCLVTTSSFAMDNNECKAYVQKKDASVSNQKEYQTPRGVNIVYGEDKSPDSASMYMIATNKKSSSANTRRILSMDGGGLRGVYEIVTLAVLEHIMNSAQHNPNLNGHSHSISDYFDVVGGTSTGSIIATGFLSRHNYSAMDLLFLYGRYGYKIFDEQLRSLRGLNGAIYDSRGVEELLVMHFGKDTLQDIKSDKRLFIIGFDCEAQEAMVYTSHVMTSPLDRKYENHKTPMVEAIGVSTAAPVYFPARNQIKGRTKILMKDGGLAANNPAYTIYQSETKEIPANYEIYSLGTGLVPATEDTGDSGYLGAPKVIEEVFAAQVSAVERNCREAVEDANSELRYYVRLQPKLEAGKGDMDNTSAEYLQYAINKSLEVTKGQAFMNMLNRLGLNAPSMEEMASIHTNIINKLKYSLSSYKDKDQPIFPQLSIYKNDLQLTRTKLEHEFILKKLSQRDFEFYVNLCDANGVTIPAERKEKLLKDLIEDYAKNNPSGILGSLASYFGYQTPESVKEMILRGADFHKLSKPLPKLKDSEIHGGITCEYAMQLFAEFQNCLDTDKRYERTTFGSAAPFFDTVATIYWKNKFFEIRANLDQEKLRAFHAALLKYAQENVTKNSSTGNHFLANTFRGSNGVDLVSYLKKCIDGKAL